MKNLRKLFSLVIIALLFVIVNAKVSVSAETEYTENVIPVMTSNTSPSGVANASTIWSSTQDYYAYRAFDHATNAQYGWASQLATGWLGYEFSEAKCITKYTIISRNSYTNIGEMPKNWTFQAWDIQLNEWVVLDKRENVTSWERLVKKEFTFDNTKSYTKYRINITANCGHNFISIGELEMMETISTTSTLSATVSNSYVNLAWNAVTNAQSYNIKRFTTSGGPYEMIATSSNISYIDKDVKPGITYYYVVSAVISGVEGENSNEVSATVLNTSNVLKVVLEKNEVKQLSVSDELSDNIDLIWTSSDTTIATVDVNGKVKALKPGNTVITCTSTDGEYTDVINVLVVDLGYQLAVDLYIGEKCRVTINDLNDINKVTWTVNDPSIATISSQGRITAVSEGLTFITATDKEGNEIGQIYVRVRK